MSLAKPRRVRDPKYLAWIRTQPCDVWDFCGETCSKKSDAHHVREKGRGGVGTKPSDRRAIPLCRNAHRLYHDVGPTEFEILTGVNLELAIQRLNAEYDKLHPSTVEKKSRSIPRLQHLLILCECKKVHRIPEKKAVLFGDAAGILKLTFSCPILRQQQEIVLTKAF